MSIINFGGTFQKVNKSFEQIVKENYEKEKNNLPFKIGDEVKIMLSDDEWHSIGELFKDKIFSVIDVDSWSWAENEFYYTLNTNHQINLFLARQLVRV